MPRRKAGKMPGGKGRARARVLAAAHAVYRDVGARRFTLNEVASRARLTTPALYRHYAGKEELLGELVAGGFERFGESLSRAAREGRTPRERLMKTSAAYFDFAADHPQDYETIFMAADIPGLRRFPRDFEHGRSKTFEMLVERVRESVAAGVLAKGDPAAIALSMWVHVHGFMALYLAGRFGPNRAAARRLYDASLQRLLQGLYP